MYLKKYLLLKRLIVKNVRLLWSRTLKYQLFYKCLMPLASIYLL